MITLIEASNYRCLRYVHRPLKSFHVLVGPNASGKTTFLDVIGFLRDLVSDGLDAALYKRASNPEELLFRSQGNRMELAVEARIPDALRQLTSKPDLDTARYQVAIGFDETQRQFEFKAETLLLKRSLGTHVSRQKPLFPMPSPGPESLLSSIRKHGSKVAVNKVAGGNDNFYSETYSRSGRGWAPSFKLGPQKSALGNLLADEKSFPVSTWFQRYITAGVQKLVLNSLFIKRPSPPRRIEGFLPDGSNLPWVVARLCHDYPDRHRAWIQHLRTALPDLQNIEAHERPEDKHCFMVYEYSGGLKVPSWLVSDGTLRLTALTLPAYLANQEGIYLVEEPENGIHPRAAETVFASLSSVYDAQVLMATHSPVVLNAAKLDEVLCFAKDEEGSTDIVLGSEHPRLQEWHGEADLGTLLASGVLG